MWNEYNNAGGIRIGSEWQRYETKEQGFMAMETLLEGYVEEFGYDLKAIRNKYCGSHCGEQDLITFKQIYQEELKNARSKN